VRHEARSSVAAPVGVTPGHLEGLHLTAASSGKCLPRRKRVEGLLCVRRLPPPLMGAGAVITQFGHAGLVPLFANAIGSRSDAVRPVLGARRGRVPALPLTVVPLDEKDVSCCTSPAGKRPKREKCYMSRAPAPMDRWRS
jgi:hypothetical protein